jgi:hypothetical protein
VVPAQLAAQVTCACTLPPPALQTITALSAWATVPHALCGGGGGGGGRALVLAGRQGVVWRVAHAQVVATSAVLPTCSPRALLHSPAGLGALLCSLTIHPTTPPGL